MATIAQLDIGTAVDPSGIDAGLNQAARKLEGFARTVDASGAGQTMANDIIAGLQKSLADSQAKMQAALENGLLDPAQLARLAEEASTAYTTGLKRGLGSLAAKGLITDDVRSQFEAAFGTMGASSAKAFATSFSAVSEHVDLLLRGATLPSTQVESIKGLQQADVALQASLKSGTLTFQQRIQVEEELRRVQSQLAESAEQAAAAQQQAAQAGAQAAESAGLLGKFVNTTTGEFTALGRRGANALVGIAFALDGLAQSGGGARASLSGILRSVATVAPAFGPGGLLVSAIAAGTDAMITIFSRTNEEMKKATDSALAEMDRLNRAGATAAAQAANTISQGNPFAATGDERVGLSGLKRQKAELQAYIATIKASEKYKQLEESVQRLRAMGVTQVEAYTVQQKGLLHGLDEQLADVEGRIAPMQERLDNVIGLTHRLASAEAERAATGARLAKEADAAAKALKAGALETRVANIAAAASIAQAAVAQIPAALAGVDAGVAANTEAAREFVAVYQSTALEAFDEVTRRIKEHGPVLDEDLAKLAQMRSQFAALPVVQMLRLETPKVEPLVKVVGELTAVESPPNLPPVTVPLSFDERELNTLAEHLAALTGAREAAQAAGLGAETKRRQTEEAQGVLDLVGAWRQYVTVLIAGGASAEELAEAAKRFQKLLKDAGIDAGALGLSLESAGGGLEGAAAAARGLGDAFGDVGNSVGDAISDVSRLKSAIDTLKKPDMGFEGFADFMGGIGAISSLAGVIGSAFGQSPTEQEHDRILSENNQALADLAASLDRFGQTAASIGNVQRGVAAVAASNFELQAPSDIPTERTRELLAKFGLTLEQVNKIAKDNGIQILDDKGRVVADAFDQLATALGITTDILTHWGSSFDEQRRLLDLANQASGIERTPAQQVADTIRLITDQAGANIDAMFSGVDASTEEGRKQIRQVIASLVTAIQQGAVSLSDIGNFADVTELGGALGTLLDSLDAMGKSVDAVTDSLLNVPTGFKVALARFRATLPDEPPEPATPPSSPGSPGSGGPSVPTTVPPEPPVVIPPLVFPENASVAIQDTQFQDLLEALRQNGGVGATDSGGGFTINGDVYVDARTKPVEEAWDETVTLLRRRSRSGEAPLQGVRLS